ncbi:hypothetical protein IT084_06665 [Desulfallas sp. Bu1-1]|uniref:hypothetical protein n=1 Tax=Desulfallas sp. Bu1-1 TaxID=2787620 RepID=UPI00189E7B1D|nr:hypothetical protein [Desulfallas sp. Bu1-1]MBF7082658.1 hypothetical protein [Desulfallas sp. Bu1-1]
MDVGEESIRAALRRIRVKQEHISALLGVAAEEITWALAARDEIARERKRGRQAAREAEKAEKRKEKEYRQPKQAPKLFTWRGKANWPASKTATKKSLSTAELVRACAPHYSFNKESRRYEGDHYVLNSCGSQLPKSITLSQIQNML